MFARNKHSPKKHQNSGKMKDNSSCGTSNFKQKDAKNSDLSQLVEDKEITLPLLKMVDSEKYLQTYCSS